MVAPGEVAASLHSGADCLLTVGLPPTGEPPNRAASALPHVAVQEHGLMAPIFSCMQETSLTIF